MAANLILEAGNQCHLFIIYHLPKHFLHLIVIATPPRMQRSYMDEGMTPREIRHAPKVTGLVGDRASLEEDPLT